MDVEPLRIPAQPVNRCVFRCAKPLIVLAGLILTGQVLFSQSLQAQIPEVESQSKFHEIAVEVFVAGDTDRSAGALKFAEKLAEREGIRLFVHDVLADKAQLARLWELSRKHGFSKAGAPAFYACDRLSLGFDDSPETAERIEQLLTMDVYTRATCPRCASAKAYLKNFRQRWPGLRVKVHEVATDAGASRRWEELCREHQVLPGLPTFHIGRRIIVGYQGDTITGRQVEEIVESLSGQALIRSAEESASQEDSVTGNDSPTPGQARRMPRGNRIFGADLATPGGALLTPVIASAGMWQMALVTFPTHQQDNLDDIPLPDPVPSGDPPATRETGAPTAETEEGTIHVPFFGDLQVSHLGLPLFTFLVGLVDGFNPCAMWVLVFLLSVLVNLKSRSRILLVAGTFVVVSGLAYFAFMAAWLNVFMLIGFARPVQIGLGLMAVLIGAVNIKDFFWFRKGITFSIPDSKKPGIYARVRQIIAAKYMTAALAGAVVLAVVVNIIELMCTAGLPALYTQILTSQQLSVWGNYSYLALYIAAYMLDDTLLVGIIVVTLSRRRLQEDEGRWLKLISGAVILGLGVMMIFCPEWLHFGAD